MKDKSQLKKISMTQHCIWQSLSADDRCSVFLEMGEWIVQEIDLDDELSVPTFKNDLQESGE